MKLIISSNQILAFSLVTLLLFDNCLAAQSADEQQARRFSIAISGGASMGSYEAGLNWGLLKILRDIDKLNKSVTGQAHSFNAVSFSGASAGGINTLLSALNWCSRSESEGGLPNTIDSNIFRDLWLLPDVNRLLPSTPDSKYYSSNDALLSRYDILRAAGNLRDQWNKPVFRAGCRIPLGVTVTRVVPEELKVSNIEVQNQRMFIPFEARTQKDGTLGFYFNPRDYPTMADPAMILMPRKRNAPPFSIDDHFIEEAVMTSAAFPGGFGRKRLQYCRQDSYTVVNSSKSARKSNQQKKTTELVCPEGYELAEAEFADGGLFDNLPIGLARKLAEQRKHTNKNTLPVTYIYLDPNRLRYKIPPAVDIPACDSDNPPKACEIMEFSLFTEQELLLGALGTARKYELFRELTSKHWSVNITQLSYELANKLEKNNSRLNCEKEIPFFSSKLSCAGSVRRAGALMEMAYNYTYLPINKPYSVEKLSILGLAYDCQHSQKNSTIQRQVECKFNVNRYRERLVKILLNIVENDKQFTKEFKQKIYKAKLSILNDRKLKVTNRGAPITGTLLSSFGAFLDFKFREYDYYVGVYDAVITTVNTVCGLKFNEQYQKQEFSQCQNIYVKKIYDVVGVKKSPRFQYLFSRLAQWEFGKQNTLRFAYIPQPKEDRDTRIIFEGLIKSMESGERYGIKKQGAFFTENTFFHHLKKEKFQPTATTDGTTPLLTKIIDKPEKWTSEMVRRITTRLVYLEQQAEAIYAAREPDPDKRDSSNTLLMGLAAHSLQTVTYIYPDFTFATSTAPENWVWRNVIPYEVAFDFAQTDVTLTWQPTWTLSNYDLLGIRASLGFVGGIVDPSNSFTRKNYGVLGLDYSRQTDSLTLSSWGLTPSWYHTWSNPTILYKQDTFGGDVHVSFMKDRLRIGLGARNFNNVSKTWFITLGLTDLPGLIYWLTR